jgi:magnesium transporter
MDNPPAPAGPPSAASNRTTPDKPCIPIPRFGVTRIKLGMPEGTTGPETGDDDRCDDRPAPQPTEITCYDYCPEQFESHTHTDVASFIPSHRPPWCKVRWINVDGLADESAIRDIAKKYELHPLVIEDIFNQSHRPKAEDYKGADGHPDRLFVIARMLRIEEGYLYSEQVSFFLGRNTLLTFQQDRGDVFDPLREQIKKADSRLRRGDVSTLLQAQLDMIVDCIFPLLEVYAERLEALEETILTNPHPSNLKAIHQTKRELLLIRRAAWPLREVIHQLQREPHVCLSETTQVYFRDVYDHIIQILDLIETYREFAAGLTEGYMSAVSNRMNEIMKVLTIISTIFVPLTFLAGVYGMNMPIPEAASAYTYPAFWAVSIVLGGSMLYMFRRKGWI